MYDPENAMRRQNDLDFFRETASEAEEQFGVDSVYAQLSRLIADIFEDIVRCDEDLDNCFDFEEQRRLLARGRELVELAKKVIDLLETYR